MPNIDVGTLAPHVAHYVNAIRQAALANFGWLGPDVVQLIIQLGYHTDAQPLQERYDAKLKLLVKSGAATQYESASVFALLWAIGEVVQKAKLLPDVWNIEKTVRWGWDTFNEGGEAGRMQPLETTREALTSYLLSNPARFPYHDTPRDHVSYQGAEGWRSRKDETRFYVTEKAFNRIVGEHTDVLSFRKYLAAEGVLEKDGKNYWWKTVPLIGDVKHARICVEMDADARTLVPGGLTDLASGKLH